ncbi:MAG: hypothetical protein ACRCZF_16730 [Gemmataceae bacterium]
MTIPAAWTRPHFTVPGADGFLFWVAFGAIDLSVPLDRDYYRAAGVPAGLELHLLDRRQHASQFLQILEGHDWFVARSDEPGLAALAEQTVQAVVLRGLLPDADHLGGLREALGILSYIVDRGASVIYTVQTFQLHDARLWQQTFHAPDRPRTNDHVTILVSPQGDGFNWYHTRGMRLFGRPDFSIHDVAHHHHQGVIELLNRYIEWSALGGIVEEGDLIRVPVLPEGGECFLGGSLDDPHFNNTHVEIRWPDGLKN